MRRDEIKSIQPEDMLARFANHANYFRWASHWQLTQQFIDPQPLCPWITSCPLIPQCRGRSGLEAFATTSALAVLAESSSCVRLHSPSPHARTATNRKSNTCAATSRQTATSSHQQTVSSLSSNVEEEKYCAVQLSMPLCHNPVIGILASQKRALRRAQSSSTPQTKLKHRISDCQTRGALSHNA